MNKKKDHLNIAIRADSSDRIGAGHIQRCLSLREYFLQKYPSAHFIFFCASIQPRIEKLLKNKKISFFKLAEFKNQESDYQDICKILESEKLKFDLFIVDHYKLDVQWEKKIKRFSRKLLVIDDLANRKHDCDFLLDQAYLKLNQNPYISLCTPETTFFLGPKYALLRPIFHESTTKVRKQLNEVLVCLGGIAYPEALEKVIQAIQNIQNSSIRFKIITGAKHNLNLIELQTKLKNVEFFDFAENIQDMMLSADLAIIGGGGTIWETAKLKLPTINIIVSDNQERNMQSLQKDNLLVLAGWWDKLSPEELTNMILEFQQNPSKLSKMSAALAKLTEENGTKIIVDQIIQRIINDK